MTTKLSMNIVTGRAMASLGILIGPPPAANETAGDRRQSS
jgi:hypothetical protein